MLKGEQVKLRPVQQSDLEQLYEYHQDISNRGPFFPIGVMSEPRLRSQFLETGMWQKNEGMLVIEDKKQRIVGHIEFYQTVPYLDELELSYHIYSAEHSGKGYASEAVSMLTDYLFDRRRENRIRLVIHPDNAASKRVAEKCGYKYEGTMRGAWYHRGENHDVDVFCLLRAER